MKKLILLTLIISFSGYSQVGIGTTMPNSTFEIVAANPTGSTTSVDGILIPRVDRQRAQSMSGIQTSTMIYVNSIATGSAAGTAANITSTGFYFYDGSVWQKITTGATTNWSLTGNGGTTPGTNFIGTTDAFDVRIKTGGNDRWNISDTNAGQLQSYSLGTALFPSYSFQTDTNTGMFSSSADFLAFTTAGSQRMTVGSTGNVGIGITNPGFTLDLASTARGINATTSAGTSAAIFGFNTAASGAGVGGYGIAGQTNQSGSSAVRGEQINANGDALTAINFAASGSGVGSGIYAQTSQSAGTGIDALNINTAGTAIYSAGQNAPGTYLVAGSGGSFNGVTTGVHARNTSTGISQAVYSDNGGVICRVNYWSGTTQYKILGTGTVSTTAENVNGERVTLHCTEAPEIYFEDYGQGQLVNGRVHIAIDPTIAKNITVNEKHPLRVFIQLEDECNGVFVTNKTGSSFDVVELASGHSNAKFQYRIVGNRADEILPNGRISKNADTRFELAPKSLETKEVSAIDVGKPTSVK